MALLSLNDARFDYGREKILRGVNLALQSGVKYALVGANGVGKSTLARIISGDLEKEEGALVRSPGCRVAYVHQSPSFPSKQSILEALGGEWEPLRLDLRRAEDALASKETGEPQ